MKKTLIGISLLFAGIMNTLVLIICAISYLPDINSWSRDYSSKLWFLIFAGFSPFGDGADGLKLGPLFVFGLILIALGLIILGFEYYNEYKEQKLKI